jgi:hypothetical protein
LAGVPSSSTCAESRVSCQPERRIRNDTRDRQQRVRR